MSALERLQAENRELREELAEWRRGVSADEKRREEAAHWRLVLGMRPQAVSVVQLLSTRPGQFFSRWQLHDHITENGMDLNLVSVAVSHARSALRNKGLGNAIVSAWGHGYKITPAAAEAVKAMVRR